MKRFSINHKKKTVLAAVLALFALASLSGAADTVPSEFRKKLDSEIQKLNDRYEDAKKEMDEEYATIFEEKNENCHAIYGKFKDAHERRLVDNIALGREEGKIRETVAAVDMNPQSPALKQALAPAEARQTQVDSVYEQSLDTLRQLYQLNDKRFNELLKIHSAREALEESRYREERDLITRRLMNEWSTERAAKNGGDKFEAEARAKDAAQMEKDAQSRYHDTLATLDEFKNLVNRRIDTQKSYLLEQDSIMKELAKAGTTPENRNPLARRLSELNAKKMADERRYLAEVRFTEDKLNFQRLRNRELSGLAAERRDMEQAWAKLQDTYQQERGGIENSLKAASIPELEKTALKENMTALSAKLDSDKKAYEQAVKNLDERVKLTEKAMDDRLSYLKERNDIRVRMADNPMSQENYDKYRTEIGQLEDRRINGEQKIRNQMMNLGSAVPAAFRETPWTKGNMETRKARVDSNFENAMADIENRWQAEEAGFKNSLDAFDKQLAAGGLAEEQRQGVLEEKSKIQEEYEAARKSFEEALRSLDVRREAEQKRLIERSRYMTQRRELQSGRDASGRKMVSADKIDAQVRALDGKWADQEKIYRRTDTELPEPSSIRGNRQAADDATRQTVRNANAADTRTEHGEDIDSSLRDAYNTVKDSVSNTYHDAVHYLTD